MYKTFKKSHFITIGYTSSQEFPHIQLTMSPLVAKGFVEGHDNLIDNIRADLKKALEYLETKKAKE